MPNDTSCTYSDNKTQALVNLAVEAWRFSRVFKRMLKKLDEADAARQASQLRWFVKKIEESLSELRLEFVDLEGHVFDPGVAAIPLNIQEFDSNDKLIIDQMLEPIITGEQGLVKTGTIILRKAVQ